MRQITSESIDNFNAGNNWRKANMETRNYIDHNGDAMTAMFLHGNAIARRNMDTYTLEICDGGWQTVTTKERLNGLHGVSVNQKNWEWFLNGEAWSGEWTAV